MSGQFLDTTLGILAWAAFTIVYAWCSLKLPWWWCTLLGWAVYSAIAVLLVPVTLALGWAFVLVSAALALILWAFPRMPQSASPVVHGKYELALRMVTASITV